MEKVKQLIHEYGGKDTNDLYEEVHELEADQLNLRTALESIKFNLERKGNKSWTWQIADKALKISKGEI